MKKAKQTLNAVDFLGRLVGVAKSTSREFVWLVCTPLLQSSCCLALTPPHCFWTISCVSGLVTHQLYSTWKHGYRMRKKPNLYFIHTSTLHFSLSQLPWGRHLWDLVQTTKLLGLEKICWNQLLSGILFESLVPKHSHKHHQDNGDVTWDKNKDVPAACFWPQHFTSPRSPEGLSVERV